MFGGFSSTKLKVQLKMAVSRIQIASNKKGALLKQSRREVAKMLTEKPPKEEMAGIKAEALIRDDQMIEALEILQLQCELIHERIKLIDVSKKCPEDLLAVVSTIIWASHRVDIQELILVRKQFRAKYGKKFEDDALANKNNVLNERVVGKLSVQPPAAYLVQCYLERICEHEKINWQPRVKLSASQMVEPMVAPSGYSVQAGQGSGLGPTPVALQAQQPIPSKPSGEIPSALKIYDPIPPTPPVVPAEPYLPPPAPTSKPGADFEEQDIYVPPSVSSSKINGETKTNNDDDSNNGASSGEQPARSGSSNAGASYEDLAARFENLKNI
mmetsp:Transcript_19236/g.24791  ORF Transcript_19236/g.24791 Transcript_19236/m.24791 type:complete len:328 (-) Transcript_19236:298-1281(-)|eukprot:CAMPEP_0198147848 /NCGR_PEP_ID=MMETSP1443-20131203/38159_1 /TAXON_ID=186043 /ORGANISM="Entomoneis sp., Strain CCMP2396" /LENGTH=327 /DNA_ID=CAMNT_0043812349 /DNA_START=82 /DNA_END=1065 /DNA_ORIENTATION=-